MRAQPAKTAHFQLGNVPKQKFEHLFTLEMSLNFLFESISKLEIASNFEIGDLSKVKNGILRVAVLCGNHFRNTHILERKTLLEREKSRLERRLCSEWRTRRESNAGPTA